MSVLEKKFHFFSKEKKHEEQLKKFCLLKNRLETMHIDEFDMRYIQNKEIVSRKKFILNSCLVVFFLSFLSFSFIVLKNFSVLFVKYLNGNVAKDLSDITIYITVTSIALLFLILVFCLIIVAVIFNDVKKVERELFLMEQIRGNRMEKR